MKSFVPGNPESLSRTVKGVYSCSLSRDENSRTGTKVCFNTKFSDWLFTRRVLIGSLSVSLVLVSIEFRICFRLLSRILPKDFYVPASFFTDSRKV